MQTFTPEQYRAAFYKCNEATRAFITSDDARDHMNRVANEFGLKPPQLQKFNEVFDVVLYGLVRIEDAAAILVGELGVERPMAEKMVQQSTASFLSCMTATAPPQSRPDVASTSMQSVDDGLVATSIHTAIDAYGLVRERLERLPQTVQETIRSQQLEANLASLLTKHGLEENLAPIFVAEAVRVMVGLTTTNNFKTEVTRAAGWDPNRLDALFLDAESLLFKPVRLSIMQALEQKQTSTDSVKHGDAVVPRPPSTTGAESQNQDPYRESV